MWASAQRPASLSSTMVPSWPWKTAVHQYKVIASNPGTPIVAVAPWIGDSRINPNSSPDDITRGRDVELALVRERVRQLGPVRPAR